MSPTGEQAQMDRRRRTQQQQRRREEGRPVANAAPRTEDRPGEETQVPESVVPAEEPNVPEGHVGGQEENQANGLELVPISQELVVVSEQTQQDDVGREGQTRTTVESLEVFQASSQSATRESGLRELEDLDQGRGFVTPSHPQSMPQSFAPPLFSPEQIELARRVQTEATILNEGRQFMESAPTGSENIPLWQVPANFMQWWQQTMNQGPTRQTPEDMQWRLQMQQDMQDMKVMLCATKVENDRLRTELRAAKDYERASSFATPEEFRRGDQPRTPHQRRKEIVEAQEELLRNMGLDRPEDGAPSREGAQQETEEDGAGARQGRKEDGIPSREGIQQAEKKDGVPSREGTQQDRGRRSEEDGAGARQGRRFQEDGAGARQDQGGTRAQELEFMMLMLQSMQELQRKISDDKENKDGMEVVRNGAPDLPQLAEWSATDGPLAMGDCTS